MLCEQGATFQLMLTWRDGSGNAVDMTGFTGKMQVRKSKGAADALLTLTTDPDGGIEFNDAGGILLIITSEQTTDLDEGQYVYDLEINTGSTIVRLLEGAFVVNGEVTR